MAAGGPLLQPDPGGAQIPAEEVHGAPGAPGRVGERATVAGGDAGHQQGRPDGGDRGQDRARGGTAGTRQGPEDHGPGLGAQVLRSGASSFSIS